MEVQNEPEREIRAATICMAATPSEKAAFTAFCESKDLPPSQMLRLMLSRVCPGKIEPGEVSTEKRPRKDGALFVTLTKTEAEAVRKRARQESTTGPSWVRKIIRTMLLKQPNFNPTEASALCESNRELGYLGRNINQIARELHISLNATDQINAKRLEALAKEISMHRDKVYALLNANWGRMGGNE